MRARFAFALLAGITALPIAAQAQTYYGSPGYGSPGWGGGYTREDAAGGAAVGGAVAGPVGAAAGAIVGGTVGMASDVATAAFQPPPAPVVTYVQREHLASVPVQEEVVVGRPLPRTVVLHRVPKYKYEYAVVNDRRVIVEPGTRRVVKIIE